MKRLFTTPKPQPAVIGFEITTLTIRLEPAPIGRRVVATVTPLYDDGTRGQPSEAQIEWIPALRQAARDFAVVALDALTTGPLTEPGTNTVDP